MRKTKLSPISAFLAKFESLTVVIRHSLAADGQIE
jgi:hypothetical protein